MLDPRGPLFGLVIGLVAFAYSAVGHGGASGYLAVMGLAQVPREQAAVTALVLNLFVAGTSFFLFRRARHFDWKVTWPLLVGSIPMAFLGGKLKITDLVYDLGLSAILVYAAVQLALGPTAPNEETRKPSVGVAVGVGAGIGLLSGLFGVGGGIFLSPLMILGRWTDAKATAATSALFILANSAAGLLARGPTAVAAATSFPAAVVAGVAGALAGAYLGSGRAPNLVLRRTLGGVLLFATVKTLTR